MAESIVLGKDTQTNSNILISQENLESGTYVLGVQGVGKSSLLLDMTLQQMEGGESVIVLDPHGDLVRDIVSRMPASRIQDTYLLDLKEARKFPFGLNIFALPPDKLNSPEARDSVRNQVMHAFEKLWPETRSGIYFGNVLRPVIATLIEHQELTLAHVPRLFYHDAFRAHYTKQLKNMEAQDFWGEYAVWSRSKRERYADPLLDRVKKLLSDDVVRCMLWHAEFDTHGGKMIP